MNPTLSPASSPLLGAMLSTFVLVSGPAVGQDSAGKAEAPLDLAGESEDLGLAPMIEESNPDLLRIPWGKKVHDLTKGGKPDEAYATWGAAMGAGENPLPQAELQRSMWERLNIAASQLVKIGKLPVSLSAGVGYWLEPTPQGPEGFRFRLQMTLVLPK